MFEKLKFLAGRINTYPVFVIGTGRSGTHWLGYSLGDHPEIRATVEGKPMFELSTRMALNPELENALYPKLVSAYKWQLFKSVPRVYLDKTHPNIWIAERLKESFPDALFVGIERDPYATVASMMKHKGVAAWHRRWKEFPVPNRFLGITKGLESSYDDLPLASQCAMRWVAHRTRMRELKSILGDALFLISYEKFARETEGVIQDIRKFLNLKKPVPVPSVKVESLSKWKQQLSDEEILQIQTIVGSPPGKAID